MGEYSKDDVLEMLEREGFQLGGSRRMACKYPGQITLTPETDYDFYCEKSLDKEMILDEYGFHRINLKDRKYCDNLLIVMYKHPEYPIEVLVRHSVKLYTRVFESISLEQYKGFIWKSSPSLLKPFNRNDVKGFLDYLFCIMARGDESAVWSPYSDSSDDIPF